MRTVDLIQKKREGLALTDSEIDFLVRRYVQDEIPDYQMAAFCMAVFFRGMTAKETTALTLSMVGSGDTVDLSSVPGIKVDKHSTGGVGDTTTLVLTPLVASAGAPVAKMAGRGLGHTGGTIDKLESIPGMRTALSKEEFIAQVSNIKLAVTAQSKNLVPADKKLYALRDVTATVESIPLIASSIMSKKIAAGADALVLDVKTGSGAFMKNETEAVKLAHALVEIGKMAGKKTVAVVSDMNQPLGTAIGNALEVQEAVQVLRGRTKGRLYDLCLALGTQMLLLAGKAQSEPDARKLLQELLASGAAFNKLVEMIKAQGGDAAVLEDISLLPQANFRQEIYALNDGYLQVKNAGLIGQAAMLSGAGRDQAGDKIEQSAGLRLHCRAGEPVKKGQLLLTVFYNDKSKLSGVLEVLREAIEVSNTPWEEKPLVYKIIS